MICDCERSANGLGIGGRECDCMEPHVLYEGYDPEAPETIKDRNGYVVLALCKVCGLAEIELTEQIYCRGAKP